MPPSVPWSLFISSVSFAASFLVIRSKSPFVLTGLELLEQADPLLDRHEVGEHAAEPALVDVRHARRASPPGRPAPGPASWSRRTGPARRGRRSRGRTRGRRRGGDTVWARSMMWIPLRSAKMNGRILGFQRRVWWPKWTPASSSCRIETDGTVSDLLSVRSSADLVAGDRAAPRWASGAGTARSERSACELRAPKARHGHGSAGSGSLADSRTGRECSTGPAEARAGHQPRIRRRPR